MHSRETRVYDGTELVIDRDLDHQVLHLEIEENALPWDKLSQDPLAELVDASNRDSPLDLFPTINEISGPGHEVFVSASILAFKAKRFDEEVYAAIEHLCERDRPGFLSKPTLMKKLMAELSDRYDPEEPDPALVDAMGFIWLAAKLGGQELAAGHNIHLAGNEHRKRFMAGTDGKPVGLYSQTLELRHIFRRDCFLGQPLNPQIATCLASALAEDPVLEKAYGDVLWLVSRLTSSFSQPPLPYSGSIQDDCRFFPQHPSIEIMLERLCRPSSSGEARPMEKLVKAVRDGSIDLTTNNNSGWFDYLLHALEPLLKPESMPGAGRLVFGKRYRQHLEELFRGAVSMSREPHTRKQDYPAAQSSPRALDLAPRLSLEPLPEYYRRQARTYAYVREVLTDAFGETLMSRSYTRASRRLISNSLQSHAILEEEEALATRLTAMESLFSGAYYQTNAEMGHPVESLSGSERERLQDRLYFQNWLRSWRTDPHLRGDHRGMIPLVYDQKRKQIKVAVTLGFAQERLRVSYKETPSCTIMRSDGSPAEEVAAHWVPWCTELVYPITAVCYVDDLMGAEELRHLCDTQPTSAAILNALEKHRLKPKKI